MKPAVGWLAFSIIGMLLHVIMDWVKLTVNREELLYLKMKKNHLML
jgi:hypothetical protein